MLEEHCQLSEVYSGNCWVEERQDGRTCVTISTLHRWELSNDLLQVTVDQQGKTETRCQGYNPKPTVYGWRVNAEVLNSQFLIKRVILEINYSFNCIFTNKWKAVKCKVMVIKISSWKFQLLWNGGNAPASHHAFCSWWMNCGWITAEWDPLKVRH